MLMYQLVDHPHHTSATLLMLFFTSLHQVVAIEDHDVDEFLRLKRLSDQNCNLKNLKPPIKACLEEEEKQSNKDTKVQCQIGFNFRLCLTDAICKWCNLDTGLEADRVFRVNFPTDNKECVPYFDSYEYAHKPRCIPSDAKWAEKVDSMINPGMSNTRGNCKEDALKKQAKTGLVEILKKVMQSLKDPKAKCQLTFNTTLVFIDAACKECNGKFARAYEDTVKKKWPSDHKECAQYYDGYEYAHKRRCTRLGVDVYDIILGIVGLLCLCGCIGGLCQYFIKKKKTQGRVLAKPGSGGPGPGPGLGQSQSKLSAAGSKQSAVRSAIKSKVRSSAVMSTVVAAKSTAKSAAV